MGSAGSAATKIDFGTAAGNMASYVEDGFAFEPARLVKGNCVSGACLAINTNETSTMSFAGTPSAFTLNSLSFKLLGKPAELTLTGSNGYSAVFDTGAFAKNTYHTLTFANEFAGVMSILLTDTGTGNVRVDDIMATRAVAPVPLPAAGLLLLGGLGVLGAAGRNRRS